MSAADETQIARDVGPAQSVHGQAHGALTDLLLLGLSGAADTNHDQTITYEELYQFVKGEVSRRHQHTPQLQAVTDLNRPVFDTQARLKVPSSGIGPPSGSLRVKIAGQAPPALRGALAALRDATVTEGSYDLLLAQEDVDYRLYLANGDTLCSLPDVETVVTRLTRYLRVRELVQLQHPRQTFNVWLQVGTDSGKTVFAEGERLSIAVKSEREASFLLLNIDPHGFVSARTGQMGAGVSQILTDIGPVEPPLGDRIFATLCLAASCCWPRALDQAFARPGAGRGARATGTPQAGSGMGHNVVRTCDDQAPLTSTFSSRSLDEGLRCGT